MERLLPELGLASQTLFDAICAQTKTAVHAAGFERVMLGLSGGMDSALVAAIAAKTFGPGNVYCYMLPTHFTSRQSLDDAQKLAENLGVHYAVISIEDNFVQTQNDLEAHLSAPLNALSKENLQVRIRALYLMALSNQHGHLVLNTGNKSESVTGFSTLYGDMIGAFGPILLLYKTHVFELAAAFNEREGSAVIPDSIFEKDPSPELDESKRDADTLPPYPALDSILYTLIDGRGTLQDLLEAGYDSAEIDAVLARVKANDFKRKYDAPAPQLSLYEG